MSVRWAAKMLATLTAGVVLMTALAGCSLQKAPQDPDSESEQAASAYPELEGLSFVQDGSIWVIEDGAPRAVLEGIDPWSLRTSSSGEYITWIQPVGTDAQVTGALKGDWRPEPIWVSDLGHMLSEAIHDDLSDTIWYTVSGDATGTIGVLERAERTQPQNVPLAFEPSFSFTLDAHDGSLIVPGGTQAPARLYRVADTTELLLEAEIIFSPRVSADGKTIAMTGAMDGSQKMGLWLYDVKTTTLTQASAGPGVPMDPAWSPQGTHIAFVDSQTNTIWTVDAGGHDAKDSGLAADEGGLAW